MELIKWSANAEYVVNQIRRNLLNLKEEQIQTEDGVISVEVSADGKPVLTEEEATELINTLSPLINHLVIYGVLDKKQIMETLYEIHLCLLSSFCKFREQRRKKKCFYTYRIIEDGEVKEIKEEAEDLDLTKIMTLTESLMTLINSIISRSGYEVERWSNVLTLQFKEEDSGGI